jgi:excisionase family DNA binding protein
VAHTTTFPELLTTKEVAAVLRVTPDRVTQLARQGRIPALRLTERGDFRFRAEDVGRLIAGKDNSS